MNKQNYSFRLSRSEEDDCYVATIPEFDGVSGFGGTAQEALSEAEKSLRLAIEAYAAEGWTLPAPEGMKEFSGQIRLRMPRTMHARLVQRASDEGMSLNSYLVSLLSHGLGQSDAFEKSKKEIRSVVLENFAKVRGSATANTTSPLWGAGMKSRNTAVGENKWQN